MQRSCQKTLLELATMRYQFFHPGVQLVQDLKLSQLARSIDAVMKGILLVSKLVRTIGAGSPMRPKAMYPEVSAMGMVILSLRAWEMRKWLSKERKVKAQGE